jgi:hypothetical protein
MEAVLLDAAELWGVPPWELEKQSAIKTLTWLRKLGYYRNLENKDYKDKYG